MPRARAAAAGAQGGAVAAIAGALGYTLIAGFAVPAQRTFWMVAVVALALWSGASPRPSRTLALALAVVLVVDPWAVLAPGFWLSFGAVALIFYVAVENEAILAAQWLRVQWAVTVGLAPAALFLFGRCRSSGPLANAVAIPVVSVVVTPLALAAAVLPWDPLLLARRVAHGMAAAVPGMVRLAAGGGLAAARRRRCGPCSLALAGVAWLLAPRGMPWRATGLALMLPAVVLPPPAPAPGEAWLTTLDVGQGLAVLVRTANRALLYDAGPRVRAAGRQRRARDRALPARGRHRPAAPPPRQC